MSEKAEIVTEIKSHIMDAIENDKSKSIRQVLASLGEPEQVANRYILERGLELQKPPKHPILKWITIGLLGTLCLAMITFFSLIGITTPLIKVDEKNDRVQLLGGLIDINQDRDIKDYESVVFKGEEDISLSHIKEIKVIFSNGKFTIKNKNEDKFRFNCKTKDLKSKIKPMRDDNTLLFDLKDANISYCDLKLPANIKFTMNGNNGKVHLKKLKNHISINMVNGKINFSPDPNSEYKYQISITNGKVDNFLSSDSKAAFQVELFMVNGKIAKR